MGACSRDCPMTDTLDHDTRETLYVTDAELIRP